MALNTSAIYIGHALGASGGGWVIAHQSFTSLHWPGLAWMLLALALSLWAQRVQKRQEDRRAQVLGLD